MQSQKIIDEHMIKMYQKIIMDCGNKIEKIDKS